MYLAIVYFKVENYVYEPLQLFNICIPLSVKSWININRFNHEYINEGYFGVLPNVLNMCYKCL